MPCKEHQTKIAVHDDLTPSERSHVETCPDCLAFTAFAASLDEPLAAWRDPLSAPSRRRAVSRRPYRTALVGLGLAALLTVAMVALPARASAKEAYRRMLAQMREVGTVHLVLSQRSADGTMRKGYELWWRPGAWREQWAGRPASLKLAGEDGITFYRYDPQTGKVESAREVAAQPDYRSFDLATFAGQYMDTPARFEQPSPREIVATNGGGWSRMVFTLDPATGLPTHAEKQSLEDGTWTDSGEMEMGFDEAISEARFSPEDLMPPSP